VRAIAAALAAQAIILLAAQRTETYVSASIDARGDLRIVAADGRMSAVRKTKATRDPGDQTRFSEPVISEDQRAVGAQAFFENCCTSYDIPLQLVVYSHGKVHRLVGIGLAIFDWHFVDGGKRVAFGEQTVHFDCAIHWQLRDVDSERQLGTFEQPQACSEDPDPAPVKAPAWVSGKISGLDAR
jgi:hypothetical protein